MDYDDVTIDEPLRWPLHWSGLMISERWAWFDRLWQSVCALRTRYGLPVRSVGGSPSCRSRRSPLWRPGSIATTPASGTTRPASSPSCTRSSESPDCCATATNRSIPTATAASSRRS